jgi:chromosome segregation ATPase
MNVKLKQGWLRLAVGVAVLSTAMISAGCGMYATQTQAKITRADAVVQEARDAKAEQLASADLKAADGDVAAARLEFDKGEYAAAQRGADKGFTNGQVAVLRSKLETTNQEIANKESTMGKEELATRQRLDAKNSEIASVKQKIADLDKEISKYQKELADIKRIQDR